MWQIQVLGRILDHLCDLTRAQEANNESSLARTGNNSLATFPGRILES